MSITSSEFKGLSMGLKNKGKSARPTVKVQTMKKKDKQKLVPYGNQSPQRRSAGEIGPI